MNEIDTLFKWYEICIEHDECRDNCPYYELRHTLSGKEGCYLGMLVNAVKLLKNQL